MWNVTNGFRWSPMHYNNSCFPSCLSMILRNKNIEMNDNIIEAAWENLQQTNPPHVSMNAQAPTLAEIARDIPSSLPGSVQYQILSGSLPEPFDDSAVPVLQLHFSNPLRGIILAAQTIGGHAQLVFRMPDGYVHLSASPNLQVQDINFITGIRITHVAGGVRITDRENNPLCGGDYAVLL